MTPLYGINEFSKIQKRKSDKKLNRRNLTGIFNLGSMVAKVN